MSFVEFRPESEKQWLAGHSPSTQSAERTRGLKTGPGSGKTRSPRVVATECLLLPRPSTSSLGQSRQGRSPMPCSRPLGQASPASRALSRPPRPLSVLRLLA